ncbi:MAG TPA: helix-turn-helix transcriptional regulator [Cytophagaceae bacterium]|jgi:transcriptional regulator with XRE-family HTH domain
MEIQVEVAKRIKELRKEKGLTQEALAWKSDIDRTFMNHIETGKRNISLKSLQKIVVNGLEMSIATFFSTSQFS